MRGVKYLGVLVVSLFFLTGCSSEKTLTCTNSEESSGITSNQKITVTFVDDEVTYVKMSIDNEATDDTIIDNWDTFVSILESAFEDAEEDGIVLTTENDTDNYTFSISLEIDLEKASEDALSEYSLDDIASSSATYDEVKEAAEEEGYTCK